MGLRTAKLIKREQLTHDVIELTLETNENIEFQAGQFITIKIDDKTPPCFRAYSINSEPRENSQNFEVCLKIVPNGRGSNWLNSLKVGDEFNFLGPNGKFVFGTPAEKTVLFVATGTGLAPFKSMIIDQLQSKTSQQKLHLLFGVRNEKDIFYQNLFENLAQEHENFTFDLTLSRPDSKDWQGKHGRVTAILETLELDAANTETYICGLKAMIDDVTEILKKKGLPEESIHFEKYD